MSSRYSSSGHRDRDRRRSPSPRRRHGSPSRRGRESTPPRKERDQSTLPSSFDREPRESKDDQRNVLERMDKHCDSGPMKVILKCVNENAKVKVWTRNYKEVRGICSGYVSYFDKHWNLVMKDVEEIFLRPKKGKTPFLEDMSSSAIEKIPEAKPKVPKEKKKDTENVPPAPPAEPVTDEGKKKKKRRKKKKNKMEKRQVSHLFLRGDNIVMISVCEEEDDIEAVEEVQAADDDDDVVEIKMEN